MADGILNSDEEENYYRIGQIDVDCGRILIGDPSNKMLIINTVMGDGLYPVYATHKGQIIIDFLPAYDIYKIDEKEWAEKHHNCTEIDSDLIQWFT